VCGPWWIEPATYRKIVVSRACFIGRLVSSFRGVEQLLLRRLTPHFPHDHAWGFAGFKPCSLRPLSLGDLGDRWEHPHEALPKPQTTQVGRGKKAAYWCCSVSALDAIHLPPPLQPEDRGFQVPCRTVLPVLELRA